MKPIEIKILTYNLHKGFSLLPKDFVLHRIRDEIRQIGTDLVFLQEVVGRHDDYAKRWSNWPTQSQFEFMADQIWTHFAYGQNALYESGHHGNALLSKFPILSWKNTDISAARIESRGYLHGVIQVPESGREIHAVCLHLGLLESFRRQQVDRLCRELLEEIPADAPLIVAGDFNDWRERISETLSRKLGLKEVFLTLHQRHARSFPSLMPMFSLDRIYCRGLRPKDAQCYSQDPWRRLSDHLPIGATLLLE